MALNFNEEPQSVRVPAPGVGGEWHEFLFNLKFMAHGGAMQFHGSDGVIYDRVLVPGSYAHIYCRHRVWSDPEWVELFAVDRT